jgi:hypothetical protein
VNYAIEGFDVSSGDWDTVHGDHISLTVHLEFISRKRGNAGRPSDGIGRNNGAQNMAGKEANEVVSPRLSEKVREVVRGDGGKGIVVGSE